MRPSWRPNDKSTTLERIERKPTIGTPFLLCNVGNPPVGQSPLQDEAV